MHGDHQRTYARTALPPPAPPPFSRLEWLFLSSGYDVREGGFDEQVERVRRWLRAEVDRRLRELAKTEPVPFPCPACGELVEVSTSYHEKVRSGRVSAPLCFECKRPKQAVQAEDRGRPLHRATG